MATPNVPGTTGTNREMQKQAVSVGVEMSAFQNGTASGGACTVNGGAGSITTDTLTTAAGSTYTLTVTNNVVTAGDIVWAQVGNGTNTAGQPNLASVLASAGAWSAVIQNIHGSTAFGGTLVVGFQVLKKAPANL